MPKPIVIVGSINMDLVCRTLAMPKPGETILGSDFVTIPGGKGANQAVAAGKLSKSSEVFMVGRVGDDDFGQRLVNGLASNNVNSSYVTETTGVSSGIAVIMVDKKGENSIVVVPGANALVKPADIDRAEKLIRSAAVVVMQLEIRQETVRYTIAMCKRHGIYTILDPAPAPAGGLHKSLWDVDLFSPNQTEAEILLGLDPARRVKKKRAVEPKQTATELLARGPRSVVLKLGSKGSMALTRDEEIAPVKSFKVKVVDTTAAGDAFTGALAVARAEGIALRDSLRFANAAGALACTGFGAQPALPTRAAVDRFVRG